MSPDKVRYEPAGETDLEKPTHIVPSYKVYVKASVIEVRSHVCAAPLMKTARGPTVLVKSGTPGASVLQD